MSSNIDWSDTIKKEAEGINGEDFGEVQEVSNGSVLVQRGRRPSPAASRMTRSLAKLSRKNRLSSL